MSNSVRRAPKVAPRWALLCLMGTLSVLGSNRGAHAAIITVDNFSFEADPIGDGGFNPTITSWAKTGGAVTNNPPGAYYTGADQQGTPAGGLGPQSALLSGLSSIQSLNSLDTVQSNLTYTLTVALGNLQGFAANDVRIGFLLNDAFVTGGDITLPAAVVEAFSPQGTFGDFTFNYTSTTFDANKTLKVFFGQAGNQNVGIDNVRLSVVAAVPEPSTWAMMALGVGALSLVKRRKRRDEV